MPFVLEAQSSLKARGLGWSGLLVPPPSIFARLGGVYPSCLWGSVNLHGPVGLNTCITPSAGLHGVETGVPDDASIEPEAHLAGARFSWAACLTGVQPEDAHHPCVGSFPFTWLSVPRGPLTARAGGGVAVARSPTKRARLRLGVSWILPRLGRATSLGGAARWPVRLPSSRPYSLPTSPGSSPRDCRGGLHHQVYGSRAA